MDIKGKTAFVAGGTSGLGLAVARELSARGANLVIVGRRGALADQIAAELGNAIGVGAAGTVIASPLAGPAAD